MIELYGFSSPNVMKILIMLEEASLPFELHTVNVYGKEQDTAPFRKMTLNGRVPVIVDTEGPEGRAFTLWESGAILAYLAEKTGTFLPASPAARHVVMQWLMFQMSAIGPMIGQANHFRTSAPKGNCYAWIRYVTEVKRLFEVLEARLVQSTYLGGETYSIADIATYPWARYYEAHDVKLADIPSVRRWMQVVAERPAVTKVRQFWPSYWDKGMAKRSTAGTDELDRFYSRGSYSRASEDDYKRLHGTPYPRSVWE